MGKNHPNVDKYVVSRVRALESLLLEKGVLPPDAVDRVIRRYETDTGPMVGVRAVARAWVDPAYKQRLLADPRAALADFGLDFDMLRVVENTPGRAQRRRLHAVLVLPVGGAGPAADVVQDARLPLAHGGGAAQGARRVRAWRFRSRARSACGTRAPSCATWSCPSARRARSG